MAMVRHSDTVIDFGHERIAIMRRNMKLCWN